MKKKPIIALLFSIRDLERMIEQIKAVRPERDEDSTGLWEEHDATETEKGRFLVHSHHLEFIR